MPAVLVTLEPPSKEPEEIEFVPNLDVLSESNRCSCTSSDDNPY
ncbi:hypothetical protein BJ970_005181 [Saccharopolyspora phatthalungensis]|uniref:Uncharacterized protein n=1 Tax=Saccharopolyspora phatthalungensis TaxID=664693 RepID=A0A840QCF4_9PSEU|nr:hypothetical protein [Saccharopolyspora phatthalungensis]